MENTYTREWDRSGYTVRQSKKGWMVEGWSRMSGSISGRKVMVPFSDQIGPGQNLYAAWNSTMTYGDIVYERAKNGKNITIVRNGHVVA